MENNSQSKELSSEEIEGLKTVGIIAANWYAVSVDKNTVPFAIFNNFEYAEAYRKQFLATAAIEPWPMIVKDYRKGQSKVEGEKPDEMFTVQQMELCWNAAKDIDRSKFLDFQTWLKCQIFPIHPLHSRIKALEQANRDMKIAILNHVSTIGKHESRIKELESSQSSPVETPVRSAKEILNGRDKFGLRKYWIGIFGTERKMDVKDVLKAMEEYASQFKKGGQTEQRFTIEDMREAFDASWTTYCPFDEWIKTRKQ